MTASALWSPRQMAVACFEDTHANLMHQVILDQERGGAFNGLSQTLKLAGKVTIKLKQLHNGDNYSVQIGGH